MILDFSLYDSYIDYTATVTFIIVTASGMFNSFSGSMVEHLSSEQKVVGSSPIWSKACVVIRRFRVRIPGEIHRPVGPTVRRLTTECFFGYSAFDDRAKTVVGQNGFAKIRMQQHMM